MAGLGEFLQQTRETRGISLEEAERVTHIARRYLQALEAEDVNAFPAPVFAKGFLRNYSQYLGLDATEMVTYWPDASEPAAPAAPVETGRSDFERRAKPRRDRPVPRRSAGASVRGSNPSGKPGPLSRGDAGNTDVPAPGRVLVLVAVIVVALLIAAFGVSRLSKGSSSTPTPAAANAGSAGNTAPLAGSDNQPRATAQPPGRKAGTMPNLVGKDQRTAVQQLQQAGVTPLIIGVASANKADAPGAVLRQEPAPGTAITTSSSVTLVVNGATPGATPTVP